MAIITKAKDSEGESEMSIDHELKFKISIEELPNDLYDEVIKEFFKDDMTFIRLIGSDLRIDNCDLALWGSVKELDFMEMITRDFETKDSSEEFDTLARETIATLDKAKTFIQEWLDKRSNPAEKAA